RLRLTRHRARVYALEAAVDADGARRRVVGDELVDPSEEVLIVDRGGQLEIRRGLERDDDRERRAALALDLVKRPVELGAIEAPVDGDHLPVERVQRSEPEVSVLGELGE